jgi:hypothetical protein
VLAATRDICYPCWFSWRVFVGLGLLSSRFRINVSNLWDFMGLMIGNTCVTAHYIFGHWVVSTAKHRALSYVFLSRPCLHLSVVVV